MIIGESVEIEQGPNKFQMMLSLFDESSAHQNERRDVSFIQKGIGTDLFLLVIVGIYRSGWSGHEWIILAKDQHDIRKFVIDYSTKTRTGFARKVEKFPIENPRLVKS